MFNRLRLVLKSLLLVLLLSSCATLGVGPPQSLDQKLAYAEGVDTAVQVAATAALRAGQITSADQQQVVDLDTQAKSLIVSARALSTTDPTAAGAKLALANAVLVELQKYLNSRKGK